MRIETLRIGWMTCVRAVTAENPELVWCCDTVTLLLESPHVEVGDRRSEISMEKTAMAGRNQGRKSRAYHVLPNVLFPLDSARRRNCAALNY